MTMIQQHSTKMIVMPMVITMNKIVRSSTRGSDVITMVGYAVVGTEIITRVGMKKNEDERTKGNEPRDEGYGREKNRMVMMRSNITSCKLTKFSDTIPGIQKQK